jgi:hypothetical protein
MALQGHRDSNEVIWGAEAIGVAIGLSKRKVFHLLETGQLEGAKKIGRRWCITRHNLMANFEPCCDRHPDTVGASPEADAPSSTCDA